MGLLGTRVVSTVRDGANVGTDESAMDIGASVLLMLGDTDAADNAKGGLDESDTVEGISDDLKLGGAEDAET